MDQTEIESGVKEIFKNVLAELKEKEVALDKKMDEFESWDSLSHMELVSNSEEKFGVTLEMDEIVELDTPQKFVDLILEKTHQK